MCGSRAFDAHPVQYPCNVRGGGYKFVKTAASSSHHSESEGGERPGGGDCKDGPDGSQGGRCGGGGSIGAPRRIHSAHVCAPCHMTTRHSHLIIYRSPSQLFMSCTPRCTPAMCVRIPAGACFAVCQFRTGLVSRVGPSSTLPSPYASKVPSVAQTPVSSPKLAVTEASFNEEDILAELCTF